MKKAGDEKKRDWQSFAAGGDPATDFPPMKQANKKDAFQLSAEKVIRDHKDMVSSFPGGVGITAQAPSAGSAPIKEPANEEKKAAEERDQAKASEKKKESGKSPVLVEDETYTKKGERDFFSIDMPTFRWAKFTFKTKAPGRNSSVVMDVKPWNPKTDMEKLEAAVLSVEMPGLEWGESKLVVHGDSGIKIMRIMLTIVHDLVLVDSLIEDYLTVKPINKYVRACVIVSVNQI